VPDDDLFPTVPEGSPSPPPGSNGSAEGDDKGDAPVTGKDVAEYVEKFVTPNTEQMARITQNQTELAGTIQEMRGVLERLGISGGNDNQGGDPLDPTTFITNPEPVVKEIANTAVSEALRDQIAPILGTMVEQSHNQAVAKFRSEIDESYGDGTWQKEFAPEIDPIFERTRKEDPGQLGNEEAIRRTVNSIKGMKFDSLSDAKAQTDADRAKAVEDRRAESLDFVTSNLSGGIGLPKGKSTLTEEAKEYLDREFRATGSKPADADFLTSLNSGSTYKEWKEAQEKKTGA